MARFFFAAPEAGARRSIYLASSPELEGVSGQYFAGDHNQVRLEQSYSLAAAQRLWRVSAQLTGLEA